MKLRSTQIQRVVAGLVGVGLLALIVRPLLYNPHRPDRQITRCLSNEKQLVLGMQMYMQDYDGHFPRAIDWMDASFPYIKNKNVYRCPEVGSAQPTEFGYAFNALLSTQTLPATAKSEPLPMLYDTNDLHWNASAPSLTGMADPPRHEGGNIVGWTDGHAKFKLLKAR